MRKFWAEPQSRCWWIHRSSAVLAPQAGILVVYRSRRCALGRRDAVVLSSPSPRRRADLRAQIASAFRLRGDRRRERVPEPVGPVANDFSAPLLRGQVEGLRIEHHLVLSRVALPYLVHHASVVRQAPAPEPVQKAADTSHGRSGAVGRRRRRRRRRRRHRRGCCPRPCGVSLVHVRCDRLDVLARVSQHAEAAHALVARKVRPRVAPFEGLAQRAPVFVQHDGVFAVALQRSHKYGTPRLGDLKVMRLVDFYLIEFRYSLRHITYG
jgi:hypothetical protein